MTPYSLLSRFFVLQLSRHLQGCEGEQEESNRDLRHWDKVVKATARLKSEHDMLLNRDRTEQ